MVVTTAAATMYKRPFWEQAPDEPAPWWSKRAKGDAPPPAGGGDNQAALLQLPPAPPTAAPAMTILFIGVKKATAYEAT